MPTPDSSQMRITVLKSKIHRATVTENDIHYTGSITVDSELLANANMFEYEKVQVVNIDNGQRFETYLISGRPGSGEICLNGAAARLAVVGDRVIIMAYTELIVGDLESFRPHIVLVDKNNRILRLERSITRSTQFSAS